MNYGVDLLVSGVLPVLQDLNYRQDYREIIAAEINNIVWFILVFPTVCSRD